jgi:hypothetical protein
MFLGEKTMYEHKDSWFFCEASDGKKPLAHKIVKCEASETICFSVPPSPCTDYTAVCGMVGYEYGQPRTVFCKTLDGAMAKGAVPCPTCFPVVDEMSEEEKREGVMVKEIQREKICPDCHLPRMVVVYTIINGGAVDTSCWVHCCPCGYRYVEQSPNTSDFAY